MRVLGWKLPAVAVALAMLSVGGIVSAQAPPTPPLQDGEVYLPTANGCGVVQRPDAAAVAENRKSAASLNWSGPCKAGLAHGWGTFHPPNNPVDPRNGSTELYLGRDIGSSTSLSIFSENMLRVFKYNGRSVSSANMRVPPVHGASSLDPAYNGVRGDGTEVWGPDGTQVRAFKYSCWVALSFRLVERCRNGDSELLYGVERTVRGSQAERTLCPNPRTPAGCENLWREKAGDVIRASLAFMEEAVPADKQRRADLDALNAPYVEAWTAERGRVIGTRMAAFESPLQRLQQADARAAPARAAAEAKARADEARLGPPQYSSTCMRDFQKMINTIVRERVNSIGGIDNLWLIDFNNEGAQVLERCPSDPAAVEQARRARAEASRVRQACQRPHDADTCLQWGSNMVTTAGGSVGQVNQQYYGVWRREYDRAMSDPNYSVELGRAGAGGQVLTDNGAHQCLLNMQDLARRLRAANDSIPANETVTRAEALMWYAREARASIQATCPTAPEYQIEARTLQTAYTDTERACNQIATRTCEPRLPGAQPARSAPAAATQPPAAQPPRFQEFRPGTGSRCTVVRADGTCAPSSGQ